MREDHRARGAAAQRPDDRVARRQRLTEPVVLVGCGRHGDGCEGMDGDHGATGGESLDGGPDAGGVAPARPAAPRSSDTARPARGWRAGAASPDPGFKWDGRRWHGFNLSSDRVQLMTETTQARLSPQFWSRPTFLISLAAATLLVGYADLVRGGLTLSAAMLSLGYLIFVPIAIMTVPASAQQTLKNGKKSR